MTRCAFRTRFRTRFMTACHDKENGTLVYMSPEQVSAEPVDRRTDVFAAGIVLWRDREGMEGGRDWWLQITAAIDHVGFLVLVITEAALKSELVRREWRYARQQGVTVYPVQATSGIDFSTLPRWMRSAHFYDLDYEWSKFVSDLNTRPSRVRVPFMVDKLPEHFVEPEDISNMVAFLASDDARYITGSQMRVDLGKMNR